MDDDGLLITTNRFKLDANSNRSSRLSLSSSEPRFSKYRSYRSKNNSPTAPQRGLATKGDTMNPPTAPDEHFEPTGPNYQSVQHGFGSGSFDSGAWQAGQSRQPKHSERGTRSGDYFGDPIHRHRGHRDSDRLHPSRSRHMSGTSHPQLQAASTGWDSFSDKEQYQSYASLGIGFASLVAETLLSHPCIVLRRQCQVMNESQSYHLMPFTLMPVIYNLHKSQGIACLWKGIGSVFIVRGLHLVTENLVSEMTNFPKEVNRHSSSKKLAQHLCLKAATWALVAPFYAASLVETVQSDIASDSPGVLDCLKEGAARLLVFRSPAASSNLLPFWKLVPPIVCLGVASYAIRSLANYAVMRATESDSERQGARQYRGYRGRSTEVDSELYERFYPELLSSFVGSLLSDLLLYPLETLTHRLCVQGTRTLIDSMDSGLCVASLSTVYTGLADALVTTVRMETPLSLYRGFGALVLQFGAHLCLLRAAKMSYERLVDAWAGDGRDGRGRGGGGGGGGRGDPADSESTSSRSNLFSDSEDLGGLQGTGSRMGGRESP